jgi:hypothetical protein
VELIYLLMGRFEVSQTLHVGLYDDGDQVLKFGLPAVYLNVPEPVVGKLGFPPDETRIAERDFVSTLCDP